MKNNKIPLKEKSIVLVGFMGVGKTTVGKLIASKLSRNFIDIDEKIEKEYQMPTTEIFNTIGEKAFRKKEKETVIYYSTQKNKIISLGGGAFMQKEIRDACLANCIVFHLDITWDSWKTRLGMLVDSRPVLQGKTMEEIKSLFYERKNTYADHHSRVMIDDFDEEEVAEYIINTLQLV
ncbi:shikimate kinase [Virgibacillus sp. FSP13]